MLGCEPVMKEHSFPCCFRMAHACKPDVISRRTLSSAYHCDHQATWPWMIAFTGIIMNDRRTALSLRSVCLIASDEMEDYGVPKSYSQSERLLCVQCWQHAGADQSKEDKQGNTKKRQKEDRAWMRQQRTLWKEEVFLFDAITVKMPATSSWTGWRAKWNAGASPCTDDILDKERLFGIITEPAWEVFSISQDAFPWWCSHEHGSAVFLPSSNHSCSFCLVHVVIACIWMAGEAICAGCFAFHEPAFLLSLQAWMIMWYGRNSTWGHAMIETRLSRLQWDHPEIPVSCDSDWLSDEQQGHRMNAVSVLSDDMHAILVSVNTTRPKNTQSEQHAAFLRSCAWVSRMNPFRRGWRWCYGSREGFPFWGWT